MNVFPTHWYPSISRVEEIEGELEDLEQLAFHQAENVGGFLPDISASLRTAHNFPGFPQHQIRQWIWIASQFRLHAPDFSEVIGVAGSALNFLGRVIAEKSNLSTEDLQDLNWVLGSATEKLTTLLGPTTLRSYLSDEELAEIESRIEHFKTLPPISAEEHRTRVESHFREIQALSNKGFFATLCTKIDVLIEAVEKLEGEDAAVASAALHYLAEEEDVVPDGIGFLGLLDDIYVIEWAYSVVEGHTTWLPFLEEMLERWPFVDDLVFGEVGQRKKLDRWSRYVVCVALSSFFGERHNNLLILREAGPYGLFAALAVALEIQRSRSVHTKGSQPPFEMDQPILIGDETEKFKALYAGPCEFAGPHKYWLKVRGNGRITASEDSMTACRPSPTEHRRLSTGNEIMEWLKSRHPDPMTHIAGGGASPESHQGVLLLTMKKRAEEFLPLIRPLGVTIPNLFGMRYVTTTNKSVDLLGSTTDHPVIYVCSDPSIALELVKNPPGHIREWLVIADGAKPARTLHASLKTSGDFADTRQCTFAELHDREACRDLIKAGLKPWYLQDLDVEVPPLTPVTPQNSDNLLDRFFTRQHIHWAMTRSVHVVEQPFYENLAHIFHGLLQNLRESGADSDPSLEILGMNVSQFIRKSLAYPLELTSEMRSELKGLASRIFSYSSTLRGFSEAANLICEHFRDVQTEGIPVCNREEKLVELVKTALQKGEKKIAILCCSSHIAEKCDTATHSHPLLRSVEWVNMDGLRRMSPVDRVIIPSRVDRGTMRDVGNNGYGNCVDLVLLPFEAAMFESGRAAGLHWESKLSKHNAARYTQLQTRSGSNSNNRFGLWKTHSPAETEAPPLEETEKDLVGPIVEEDSDFEYLEGQIAEAIKKQTGKISSPDEMVSATLVIFEDVGAFAYLPPKGRVIALSDVADEISFGENPSGQELEGKKAEDMLFRPVSKLHAGLLLAFPLESDRDLLDAWTDKFLENAEETRRISSLWKHALSRHFEKTGESFSAFSQKMAAAGEAREPQTIRSWIKNSQSIAPRNFTVTVPLISKLTEDAELRDNLKKTLDAIQAIYDARAEAAVSIVKKIFSGDINLESELLTIEIEGAVLTYQLQRISVIQETREVPAELVGRVSKLGSVPVDGGLQRDPQP